MFKIYELVSENTNDVYIGKTKQKLGRRKSGHKSSYKRYINKTATKQGRINYCSFVPIRVRRWVAHFGCTFDTIGSFSPCMTSRRSACPASSPVQSIPATCRLLLSIRSGLGLKKREHAANPTYKQLGM